MALVMRCLAPQYRMSHLLCARTRKRTVALALLPLFAYTNFLCAAGFPGNCECGDESEVHDGHADHAEHHADESDRGHGERSNPRKRDEDGPRALCFCSVMAAGPPRESVDKPQEDSPIPIVAPDAVPAVIDPRASSTAFVYEHGPPTYRPSGPTSPRSPPAAS